MTPPSLSKDPKLGKVWIFDGGCVLVLVETVERGVLNTRECVVGIR